MLNPHTDNASQAVHETAREGTEQVSRITEISTDISERAARAGTEMLQRNAETIQEAVQSSAEIAARLTERSADQFGRVFGISGDEAYQAAQKSSDNLDAIIPSSSVLAVVTQSVSREWVNFTRERMEQNFNRFGACCVAAPRRTSQRCRAKFCVIIWRASFNAPADRGNVDADGRRSDEADGPSGRATPGGLSSNSARNSATRQPLAISRAASALSDPRPERFCVRSGVPHHNDVFRAGLAARKQGARCGEQRCLRHAQHRIAPSETGIKRVRCLVPSVRRCGETTTCKIMQSAVDFHLR